MPVRATKRGEERTPLGGSYDVLICGASFAGLAVARELQGSGRRVLMVDRYEVGERQTSACAAPTEWLEALGVQDAIVQTFGDLVVHRPRRTYRWKLPFTFSTFDYRHLCSLLREQGSDTTFETAKVHGRTGDTVHTDRGDLTAPLIVDAMGWRRVLSGGPPIQPPEAAFPAADEVRIGWGSFDPRKQVKDETVQLTRELGLEPNEYQGNWIPHALRPATEDGVFFAGDSAGHCLPTTAEGIRTALYFGLVLGRELRAVVDGGQTRDEALARYARFSDSHAWKFRWMLRTQRAVGRINGGVLMDALLTAMTPRYIRWSFGHYFRIAPPDVARQAPAATRAPVAA
jgi:flavin-dependent dehydrogenase